MANRIKKWWDDVEKWQGRFEKLFSATFINSRVFRKDKLHMYEQLLSRKTKDLNPEERLTKKAVNQKRRELEKELYPNRYVRLFRNMFRLSVAIGKRILAGKPDKQHTDTPATNVQRNQPKTRPEQLKRNVPDVLNQQQPAVRHSESFSASEQVDYTSHIKQDGNNLPKMDGYTASLHNGNGQPIASIHVAEDSTLSKENVRGLLNGRPVNTEGNIWKVPDLNDRDAQGNIRLKDVIVADFNMGQELNKLPIKGMDDNMKKDLEEALKNGKRPEVTLIINGKEMVVQLEANPLKRGFNFHVNNRKISLDKIKEQVTPTAKVVKMKVAQPTQKNKQTIK